MMRVLADLRRMTECPPTGALKAIGGTLESDHYSLPNQLAELVLRNAGWDAVSLGCNLPAETMVQAIQQQNPRLVWLSVSHYECEEKFISAIEQIRAAALANQSPFVIGGRMMCESLRQKVGEIACCDSMRQLDAYARALLQTQAN